MIAMSPDLINGGFEFIGSAMIWMNVRQLWKDKMTRGVHWGATTFFTSWGFWNVYYYPYLHQYWSFAGGLSIVLANCAWLYLMWKYRNA